ncbi:MAG: F0F1 ATP synthase subunit A [Planctomycetota bacterium]|jgi:F-type H+-transporting ATPase subunit a
MNLLFAGGDVVSHLSDYPLAGPWFTAHHVLLIAVAVIMIFGFSIVALRARSQPKRSGVTSLVEVGLVWIRDEIVYAWLGEKKGRKFLYFFWTLFFFILLSNLLGLLPAPLNPWHRTATGNWMVTAALAVIAFLTIQVSGMIQHGPLKYWASIVPGGVPWWLWPLLWVVEFFGLLVKPFALMIRLAANMTAGHAIIAVLFGFLLGIAHYGNVIIGGVSTVASFAFILFILLFETLVALIQAYIFTVLTAIFVSLSTAEEH